jgi:hypothetical protein
MVLEPLEGPAVVVRSELEGPVHVGIANVSKGDQNIPYVFRDGLDDMDG